MAANLSKEEKEFIKHLPDGEEILAAEEQLTKFHIDYQLILFWLEGINVMFGMIILVTVLALTPIGFRGPSSERTWAIGIRSVGMITHFSGVVAAKLKEKRLVIFVIVLGFFETALSAVLLLYPLVISARPVTEHQMMVRLQGLFVDAALCFLRLAFFAEIRRMERAKKDQKLIENNKQTKQITLPQQSDLGQVP